MRTLAVAALCCLAGSASAGEQTAEQEFKNIQVLKGTPADQLDATMDAMSAALGVGCDHCHVMGERPKTPPAFEKDDKLAKRTARKMFAMMRQIDRDFFGGAEEVTCATCHHGRVTPATIPPLGAVARVKVADAPPAGVTAKALIDRWVQASGGAAAWGKLRTRVASGTIDGFGPQPASFEQRQAAPDKWSFRVSRTRGTFRQVWDGERGWMEIDGHPHPMEDVGEARRAAPLAPPLTLPTLLGDLKVAADESIGTATMHVLEGTQGRARVRLYLDAATGLLARLQVRVPTPAGDLARQLEYEDYRTVDGVKLPFVVRRDDRVLRYARIKHGAALDAATFAPPAGP